MKKAISIILSIILTNAVFAGCDFSIIVKINGVYYQANSTVISVNKNDLVELSFYIGSQCSGPYPALYWYKFNNSNPLESEPILTSDSSIVSSTIQGIIYVAQAPLSTMYPNAFSHIQINRSDFSGVNYEAFSLSSGVLPEELHEKEISFNLFPNPAGDYLTIQIDAGETPVSGTIQVFTINGQLALTQRIQSTSTTVNTSSLQKGAYFAVISTDNGIVKNEKFLKE